MAPAPPPAPPHRQRGSGSATSTPAHSGHTAQDLGDNADQSEYEDIRRYRTANQQFHGISHRAEIGPDVDREQQDDDALQRQAEQQLSAPAPARCVALSSLHDCLEMFLDTPAEAVGARLGNRKEFKDYWPSLAAARPPIHLPMERAMAKINRTREDFKASRVKTGRRSAKGIFDHQPHVSGGCMLIMLRHFIGRGVSVGPR